MMMARQWFLLLVLQPRPRVFLLPRRHVVGHNTVSAMCLLRSGRCPRHFKVCRSPASPRVCARLRHGTTCGQGATARRRRRDVDGVVAR